MWAEGADTSGVNMPRAQRSHLTLDLSNDMFGARDSQQPAWSSSLDNEDDSSSDFQSYITYQIPAVTSGEPTPSPPASHQNEDEDLSTESGEDEARSLGDTPKTAAERQAEKRKMKRFRFVD